MTKEEKIRELKLKRMKLIADHPGDRTSPEVAAEERRILKEIEGLLK